MVFLVIGSWGLSFAPRYLETIAEVCLGLLAAIFWSMVTKGDGTFPDSPRFPREVASFRNSWKTPWKPPGMSGADDDWLGAGNPETVCSEGVEACAGIDVLRLR